VHGRTTHQNEVWWAKDISGNASRGHKTDEPSKR
jgi:hypothetical protein